MSKKNFKVAYEFCSARADGETYKVEVPFLAENERDAVSKAGLNGFTHFGAKFTDNCIDWKIVPDLGVL